MSDPIFCRCVRCRGEFTEAQITGKNACPGCGNAGAPMSPDEDVTVAINWFELRILCIWAEQWANATKARGQDTTDMLGCVFGIAKALQEQHPTRTPLTLSGEVAQLREQYPGMVTEGIAEGGPLPPKVN